MAANPQHRLLGTAADHIGGVASVLARIGVDVQVGDVELSVVVPAVDEEASSCVVNILLK